jgi:hypothetical protein
MTAAKVVKRINRPIYWSKFGFLINFPPDQIGIYVIMLYLKTFGKCTSFADCFT